MLNSNRSGLISCHELSGLVSVSFSVSSYSSGECGNAILWYCYGFNSGSGSPQVSSGDCGSAMLQYCYGFNRPQLWLLAQGLLQSVLSLQVSVATPYYSIVMVSIGVSSGS